jgi:pyruvate kinase
MDVVRLNFSHGTQREHGQTIQKVRKLARQQGKNVAVLQDLAGPKIRIGKIKNDVIELKPGENFILTSREVLGTEKEVSVSYSDLPRQVKPRDTLLLADGALQLSVIKTSPFDITCRVIIGGTLTSHKGVNLPTRTLELQALTEKDREDLNFGIDKGVDVVAISFVRKASDALSVKKIMNQRKVSIPIIAKIEKHEALDHIDEILDVVDGAMVARGDLGIETPLERIPMVQKMLIRKAIRLGKPVITATQMLRSMVSSPRPTRAEATDIANAIFDGTDALMLSEETAVGNYPVESVRMMAKIAKATEQEFPYDSFQRIDGLSREQIPDAVSLGACFLARKVDAKAIITPTESGLTARLVSRHKPLHPIIALSPNQATIRRLALSWGVIPLPVTRFRDTDDMLSKATRKAKETGIVKPGDRIVLTAGLPIGIPGITNMIRIMTIP